LPQALPQAEPTAPQVGSAQPSLRRRRKPWNKAVCGLVSSGSNEGILMKTDETAETVAPVPVLRQLGDTDAAVCVDGVCAVPQAGLQAEGAEK
jgi:hypothetical protein